MLFDRNYSLDAAIRIVEDAILIRNNLKAILLRADIQQFAWLEQEVGTARFSENLVSNSKSFVNQQSPLFDTV